jgi:Fe-S-cluster containining protein
MRADKDRPSTWGKYREGLCEGCWGSCCTMPVEVSAEDLLRLGVANQDELEGSRKKIAKKLIKEKIVITYRDSTDLFMLSSRPDGDCLYLHPKTRLCTVYEKRPEVCRKFPKIGPRPGYCPSARKTSTAF